MDKKQVLEKIQKLLSLANSSNANEAKIAADKASELLTKYNLSMQDIAGNRDYTHTTFKFGPRRQYHRDLIYSLLQEFFFIQVVQSRRQGIRGFLKGELAVLFVGEQHNVEIAKYVFEFLDRAFLEGWQKFKEKYEAEGYKGLTSHKKTYFSGFFSGVHENLKKTRYKAEQEAGLVVVKDPGIEDFLNDMFNQKLKPGKEISTDTRGGVALDEGYMQGRNTNIAIGLNNGKETDKIGETPLKLEGGLK